MANLCPRAVAPNAKKFCFGMVKAIHYSFKIKYAVMNNSTKSLQLFCMGRHTGQYCWFISMASCTFYVVKITFHVVSEILCGQPDFLYAHLVTFYLVNLTFYMFDCLFFVWSTCELVFAQSVTFYLWSTNASSSKLGCNRRTSACWCVTTTRNTASSS